MDKKSLATGHHPIHPSSIWRGRLVPRGWRPDGLSTVRARLGAVRARLGTVGARLGTVRARLAGGWLRQVG